MVGDVVAPDRLLLPDLGDPRLKVLPEGLELLSLGQAALHPGVGFLDPVFRLRKLPGLPLVLSLGDEVLVLLLLKVLPELVELPHPEGDLELFLLRRKGEELGRLLRLHPQRLNPPLQLGEDVVEPNKVLLRRGEPALGLRLAVAVFGDAGGLLEDFPPPGGPGADDFGDLALPDEGIAVPPEPGVHQKLVDVL